MSDSTDNKTITRNAKRKLSDTHERCSICLDPISEGSRVFLQCSHTFHGQCVVNWFKEKTDCPICRDEHCRVEQKKNPTSTTFIVLGL